MMEFFDLNRSQHFDELPSGSPDVTILETGEWQFETPLSPDGTINLAWGITAPRRNFAVIKLEVCIDGEWKWFQMTQWTGEVTESIPNTSFGKQAGQFGQMEVDTYRNTTPGRVTHCRVRVELHGARAKLHWLTVQAADHQKWKHVSEPLSKEPIRLPMEMQSQYSVDGGEDWCAVFSAMSILKYYDFNLVDLLQDIQSNMYDERYEGYGNWSIMAALISDRLRGSGMRAVIRNVSSYRDIEHLLNTSGPVIASLNWRNGLFTFLFKRSLRLPGGIKRTGGHLTVPCGSYGDKVVVMDPATTRPDHSDVERAFDRRAWERRLIDGSNGTIIALERAYC